MKRFITGTVILTFFALSTIGCKKTQDTDTEFDKAPLMENLASNYIIPGYSELADRLATLENSWNEFLADQTQTNLEITQQAWLDANISFQGVKGFDFGPALDNNLLGALGTFPADTIQIASNITNGSYDLSSTDNADAVGFDALDFLFYRTQALTDLQTSTAMQTYVSAVITKMKTEAETVKNAWTSYKSTFVNGTSNASTSPFALLVNSYCRDFELSKTTKIGIPIGKQSLNIQQPVYLEARRSGKGKELLIAAMTASQRVFSGYSWDGSADGSGFDDYLNALDKNDLVTTITTRMDYVIATPQTWSETIEERMQSNATSLSDYYDYMLATVVYLKTDMASDFGVLITYQDNDGD